MATALVFDREEVEEVEDWRSRLGCSSSPWIDSERLIECCTVLAPPTESPVSRRCRPHLEATTSSSFGRHQPSSVL
ncbi:MAG TPA: hypothetical protein VK926_01965 [Gaiellaceae bacterium]|nr:hypothetical protein [Gaiellaceae bacterium]